ncbi:uncharacterized membrane protein YbhN (UPF0104 family) [Stenotrophomonas rhizophila]|uniref:lysylphosphatidylglycerol synthase domain-containing protein n=1 Tax=Stenotrophomonas rhizophila TaxID=216778 RepID=UPI003399B17C
MKKNLLRLLNVLIGTAAVAGFSAYAWHAADGIDWTRLGTPSALLGILAAGVASALIIPLSAFAWMRMLRSCGVHRPWGQLATIMGLTQLGKYLPGNVAQHIGRLSMSLKAGIPAVPFTTTVVSESLLAILAAVFFGALACALGGAQVVATGVLADTAPEHLLPLLLLASIALIGIVAASPRLINRIAVRRLGSVGAPVPAARALMLAFTCYVGNYLVLAAGIWLLSHLLLENPPSAWLLTGAFALSWILGFLLPGAPAGLGVREAAMLGILQAAGGGPELLPLVVGLRMSTMLGDLLCFAVALLAVRTLRIPPDENP